MSLFSVVTIDEVARLLAVVPAEIEQVRANQRKYYRSFKRRKSDGTFRVLYDPQGPLKLLQQKVKRHILDLAPVLDCVHGGVRWRSVLTNAQPHIGKEIVFCQDIKNFYPSVQPRRVRAIFVGLGFGLEIAEFVDCNMHLGQPIAARRRDKHGIGKSGHDSGRCAIAVNLAGMHGFSYTRWIDDLDPFGSRRLLGSEG